MAGTEKRSGLSPQDFEAKRREIALEILEEAKRFFALDNEINANLVRITGAMARYVEEHPGVFAAEGNIEQAIKDIDARLSQAPKTSGGDVTGAGVFDEILGIIKEVLLGEKEFIKDIIKQILGIK
jgi:hypothetical protein